MADDKKTKEEKPEKKHAKGEGTPAPPAGEKKGKKGGKREKAPATIQAAEGKAHAKSDHPARLPAVYTAHEIAQRMIDFEDKNPMQVPKLEKIVDNMSLGD